MGFWAGFLTGVAASVLMLAAFAVAYAVVSRWLAKGGPPGGRPT